jgi:iron complex outermembrane receptor protein
LAQLNVVGQHDVTDSILLTGNVYFRNSDIDSLNGDDSDFEECEDFPGLMCLEDDDDEALIFDQDGNVIPADEALEGATINRTATRQESAGFGLQANWFGELAGRDNQLIVGLAYDASDIDFNSTTELGSLDATRLAIPGGVFIGDTLTGLVSETSSIGIYLSNSFILTERLSLTASGRYNSIDVDLIDQLGTELNGEHEFERFNPALGLSFRISADLNFFASYSEANRTPSPVELTCADEDAPCRLPNAFLADPPLEQVVSDTVELGVRGAARFGNWHVGAFRTTNDDDIIFISAGALSSEGYFDNVGETRRQGIELSLDGTLAERVDWFMHYTYLDATFESAFTVQSVNHPAAVDGEIFVDPGDRLPLVPENLLKLGFDVSIRPGLDVGVELLHSSSQFFRGDEANVAEPVDAYTVANARVDFELSDTIDLFALMENVFDTEYETFGVFGDAEEVLGPDFDDTKFLSPAAPRAFWLGIEIEF